jgi:3-oxoacyl-[acyl-carrier-protein] synthase II
MWANLIAGKSGIDKLDRFDASDFPVKVAAQVKDFDPADYMPPAEIRRIDLNAQYALAAAQMASDDAGLVVDAAEARRFGVWIGSGIGGLAAMEKLYATFSSRGPGGVPPFLVPMMISNMAAGQVSIRFGAKGPSGCTVTACASGTNSIGDAYHMIRLDKADIMLAGGCEASITPLGVAGFSSMRALSTERDPAIACRPFHLSRPGFVMGEGAGVVVLESMERALRRGARVYGELAGYGASSDAYHIVQPDAEGIGPAYAFRMALEDAGLAPEKIDYINAHGTGTKLNDLVETKAIKHVFGAHSRDLIVSSTKAATGHMLGAAGAVECIVALLALIHHTVPPTLNLTEADPECDLNYSPLIKTDRELNAVLSDSLGFGGHNAALVIRRFVA